MAALRRCIFRLEVAGRKRLAQSQEKCFRVHADLFPSLLAQVTAPSRSPAKKVPTMFIRK